MFYKDTSKKVCKKDGTVYLTGDCPKCLMEILTKEWEAKDGIYKSIINTNL